MTQGKSRMRQFRMSGSVRGVAREGDSYRDTFKCSRPNGGSKMVNGLYEIEPAIVNRVKQLLQSK
jgi:hypothetical protein